MAVSCSDSVLVTKSIQTTLSAARLFLQTGLDKLIIEWLGAAFMQKQQGLVVVGEVISLLALPLDELSSPSFRQKERSGGYRIIHCVCFY